MDYSIIDKKLKDIQTVVNKRHYTQYVLPLMDAMNSVNDKLNSIKVKSIVEKIIASSLSKIASQGESINDIEYIKVDDVSSIIHSEMNTYI
ncbi:MAG: hypothetical protein AB7V16_07390 [Vulcanibacillus sp.]